MDFLDSLSSPPTYTAADARKEDALRPFELIMDSAHSLGLLELLVEQGLDLDAKDRHGNTALHNCAALLCSLEKTKNLCDVGASIEERTLSWIFNKQGQGGRDKLYKEIGDLLREYQQRRKIQAERRLRKACVLCGKPLSFFARLLKIDRHAGCRIFLNDSITAPKTNPIDQKLRKEMRMNWLKSIFYNPPRALFQAIVDSLNDEATRLLTASPALANCSRDTHWLNGATPLHCCASAGNVMIAEKLLAMGVNVDTRTVAGETPLHVAVSSRQSVFVQLLLDKGADVRAATSRGQTPLHTACRTGDFQILTTLLNYGSACVNVTDKEGLTPLHIAAQNGKADCIELLIRHGGNIDTASAEEKKTPLHVAVANDKADCVELLVRHGANINAAAVMMVTPLHVAVTNGLESMVALLLKLGADRHLCMDFEGHRITASALACLMRAKGSVVHARIDSLLADGKPL